MKIIFVIATFLLTFSFGAIANQEKHHLEGDQDVGTKFKRKEAESSIPFDKAYSALTSAQKEVFRRNYEGMQSNETPPFPKLGMQAIYSPIIKGHKKMAREGDLFAIALIGEDGKAKKVDVYKAPSKHMAELAVTVLFNVEFDPATCDGEPCEMEFPLDIRLNVSMR